MTKNMYQICQPLRYFCLNIWPHVLVIQKYNLISHAPWFDQESQNQVYVPSPYFSQITLQVAMFRKFNWPSG